MKKIVSTLLLLLALFACADTDLLDETAFGDSYRVWMKFKEECNDSYYYVARQKIGDDCIGKTKIKVIKGVVVGRSYVEECVYEASGKKTVTQTWLETSLTLGDHSSGVEPMTLDEVYQNAKEEWLVPREGNFVIYFRAENDGVLSIAGYIDKDCVDDCFTGISIIEIKKIELDE